VFKTLLIATVLAVSGLTAQAVAFSQLSLRGTEPAMIQGLDMVQDASRYPVQPSQAVMAAQQAYPGSTVIGVKLLPNGQYAVTLKVGGSVQRVMVSATSGQVS